MPPKTIDKGRYPKDLATLPKIVKKLNRNVNGEKYYKYLIAVSKKEMEKLGWDEDTNVKAVAKGRKLVVEED